MSSEIVGVCRPTYPRQVSIENMAHAAGLGHNIECTRTITVMPEPQNGKLIMVPYAQLWYKAKIDPKWSEDPDVDEIWTAVELVKENDGNLDLSNSLYFLLIDYGAKISLKHRSGSF